ncbi:MAG: hypothetical protein WC157_00335 [Candidatus Paceibacterota bacterium]
MKIKNFLIIIFLLIAFVSLGFFWWQSTSYSKEVLKLEILGPQEISLGENMEYVVRFKNNGNVRLENPELIFEYPQGAITESEKIVLYDAEKLGGNIYPGQERTFKFNARLLGEEGNLKIAKATLSFKPKDLNVRNEVYTEFLSTIKKVPIRLDFNLPLKVTSIDKAFSFSINYASEVAYSLKDLSIFIDYPNDFEFLYSNPKALDEKQWDINNLNQFESGKIELSGIKKSDSDSAFTVRMGIWNDNEFIVLKEITSWLKVVSPSLYISQKINNVYDFVAKKGDTLHYEISFRNIGDEPLRDLILISKLDGSLFDLNTMNAPNAKYTTGDSSLLFESKSFSELEFLDVDEVGVVEFWVDLKEDSHQNIVAQKNQKVKNIVNVGQTREEFVTKIQTDLTARQYVDPNIKSGPYPLSVNKTSKITIVWEVSNTFNDVGGVLMRAIIPESVVFVNDDEHEENGLSFNVDTGELLWDVGDVLAFSDKKVCFEVIVSPQIVVPGGLPLIPGAHISGKDEWIEKRVEFKTEELKGEMVGGDIVE